jgi:amidase
MLGKTVTTEFALRHPGATANPHDPCAHAQVARRAGRPRPSRIFMVPVAFGTQTGRSIIRPGFLLRRVRLQAVVRHHQCGR